MSVLGLASVPDSHLFQTRYVCHQKDCWLCGGDHGGDGVEWMSNPAISMGNEVLGYNETSETSQAGGFQVKLFALKKAVKLLTPRFSGLGS